LSETWLTQDIQEEYINMEGFNIERRDRSTRRGGAAMYLRGCLRYKVLHKSKENDSVEQL
ncbi:hypothetical protein HHI36_004741, partial [Cryptolaemus montrouzieri]